MGAGYMKSEFHALGVDFDERNRLFDQTIEVMKQAWTGEPVTFDGAGFSARNVTAFPKVTGPAAASSSVVRREQSADVAPGGGAPVRVDAPSQRQGHGQTSEVASIGVAR